MSSTRSAKASDSDCADDCTERSARCWWRRVAGEEDRAGWMKAGVEEERERGGGGGGGQHVRVEEEVLAEEGEAEEDGGD